MDGLVATHNEQHCQPWVFSFLSVFTLIWSVLYFNNFSIEQDSDCHINLFADVISTNPSFLTIFEIDTSVCVVSYV